MTPDEELNAPSEPSQMAPVKGAPRRSRRGGRRHPRRREPRPPGLPGGAIAPSGPADFVEPGAPAEESQPDRARPERQPDHRPERRPESGPRNARVSDAIGQVTEVIEELKHALGEMEEVLETLELAERQKIDDEREIEALQNALRQLHRPGAGGGPPRR